MEEVIKKLTRLGKTISTMESCTGGGVANTITNIEGASTILKFSAVTYSNEFKIKMGVSSKVIDQYSVYSMEVAKEMSKCISDFTLSNYGVGITGKLNRIDPNNPYGDDNKVFISIYDCDHNQYKTSILEVVQKTREENKKIVIKVVKEMLLEVIK